ncbi:MAG: diguanylate cyclase [Cyanobacteria bacterium P01_F01_bin.53]
MGLTKILLIEDNPGDVYLVKELLAEAEEIQYELTHVDSLNAGLDHLNEAGCDLVLLDLGLPDSQGINTLLKLQSAAPDLPTVVLTDFNDGLFATDLVKQGAQDYLVKKEITTTWLNNTITHTVARAQWTKRRRQREQWLQSSNQALQCQLRDYRAELIHMSEQLQLLEVRAKTDALTGIANRYGFEKYFKREWDYSRKTLNHLSLIMVEVMMDAADFQVFGSTDGSLWKDECLRQVARYLKSTFKRPRDLVARYDGNRFAAVLPDTPKQRATQLAMELYEGVHHLPIRHPSAPVSGWVTIQFGIASEIPTQNGTPADFVEEAGSALHLAKTGRDRTA